MKEVMINDLTTLENVVLNYACQYLAIWRLNEPGYSCLTGNDITKHFQWKPKTTSGIISSLFKKGYFTDGYDDGITICVEWDKIPDDFGKKVIKTALSDKEREYPTPPKDGDTFYPDGTTLIGSWASRIEQWQRLNLHRIPKGY
jgi:hypothetical protein